MATLEAFDFEPAYAVEGSPGIAWRVYALETAPDEDTEWTGIEEPTGRVLAHMIGDDRPHSFDPDELTAIADEDFCGCCGQVGCAWG